MPETGGSVAGYQDAQTTGSRLSTLTDAHRYAANIAWILYPETSLCGPARHLTDTNLAAMFQGIILIAQEQRRQQNEQIRMPILSEEDCTATGWCSTRAGKELHRWNPV